MPNTRDDGGEEARAPSPVNNSSGTSSEQGYHDQFVQALEAGIQNAQSVNTLSAELVRLAALVHDVIAAKCTHVGKKSRSLEITIVNLHPSDTLRLADWNFRSGRLWYQPFGTLTPGHLKSFWVCNSSYSMMGVRGGVAFSINHANGEGSADENFICTFSNPPAGTIKGRCEIRTGKRGDLAGTDKLIDSVWKKMLNDRIIEDERFGFYRGQLPGSDPDTPSADQKLVYFYKSPNVCW